MPSYQRARALESIIAQGAETVHKFGFASVGTTYVPVAAGGIYRMPQVAGATALRIKAGGDANDTAAGTGAREVTIMGLDETGAEVEEAVATAGASASAATTATFIRVYRAYVSESGTYADATTGSHVGDITIEDSAGTEDWLTIRTASIERGQSQVGCYSIPLGFTAWIVGAQIHVDSNKALDIISFRRDNILESAAPYSALRITKELVGVTGPDSTPFQIPAGPYPELTDFGIMAKVASGSGDISVDFELVLSTQQQTVVR